MVCITSRNAATTLWLFVGRRAVNVSDSGMQLLCITSGNAASECDEDGDDVNRVSGSSLFAQRVSPDLNPRELRLVTSCCGR